MFAMVALGVGEILGAMIMGNVIDRIGSKKTCLINIGLVFVATIFVLNFLYLDKYSAFAFIMTFCWGF